MSKKRQPAPFGGDESELLARTFACRFSQGRTIETHQHDWHQLIYATSGVMTVRAEDGIWVVPPHRAVWVPAGSNHRIDASGPVEMRFVYLPSATEHALPATCVGVNVSPLLRELVVHCVRTGVLRRADPRHQRLAGVLCDQIHAAATTPLQLPSPRDPRCLRAADWLLANPGTQASLPLIANRVKASVRTIERLFLAETGMTLGRWRQQARLLHALRLLAEGRSTASTALAAGYESTSAFIAMFRRTLGSTPKRYFDDHSAG